MKGFVLRVPLLAAMLATPLLCLGPSFADSVPADTPAMKAELLFTIPWGDKWGQLKFVPEEELKEATYAGPSSLLVTPPGDLYIYDPGSRRLQRFGPDGIYQAGIQFEPGFRRELTILALGSLRADRTRPLIVADESGFVAQLEPPASSAEPARPKELLKGVIGQTTTVSRIGTINPAGLLVEERGLLDPMAYLRFYEGTSYRRRFEAVDLVQSDPWYYALAVDRALGGLYLRNSDKPGTQVVTVQRIDGYEQKVAEEIPLTLPIIEDGNRRWHLLGAGQRSGGAVFFLSARRPVFEGDEIYAVSTDRILGVAKISLPDATEQDRYIRRWNYLVGVSYTGALYVGIPTKTGYVVMRYTLPG